MVRAASQGTRTGGLGLLAKFTKPPSESREPILGFL